MLSCRRATPKSSLFEHVKKCPEIIPLSAVPHALSPHSFRNVEDLLHERSIDENRKAIRFWWHRFDPMLDSEIRKQRILGCVRATLPSYLLFIGIAVLTSTCFSGITFSLFVLIRGGLTRFNRAFRILSGYGRSFYCSVTR